MVAWWLVQMPSNLCVNGSKDTIVNLKDSIVQHVRDNLTLTDQALPNLNKPSLTLP
jgi:hypothetical protein